MRIHVTGNAGSGKTTLSARLGAELGVAVFSLDSIVWGPGWTKTPPEARAAAERRLVSQASWIIDGVSPFVRANADLVVFLDVPRRVCAWRGIVRAFRHFHRTRPDLPPRCPEMAILPRLIRLIGGFPKRAGTEIRMEAAREPHRFRIEHYPVQMDGVIQRIKGSL